MNHRKRGRDLSKLDRSKIPHITALAIDKAFERKDYDEVDRLMVFIRQSREKNKPSG